MGKEGTVINVNVVIAVGKGILMSHGKSVELTKDWARGLGEICAATNGHGETEG